MVKYKTWLDELVALKIIKRKYTKKMRKYWRQQDISKCPVCGRFKKKGEYVCSEKCWEKKHNLIRYKNFEELVT
jgi:predicted CoA-binding protein